MYDFRCILNDEVDPTWFSPSTALSLSWLTSAP